MKIENKRNTKNALILSVLLLLVSTLFFVGTAFAWFTDTATSGKNKIVAGNLDVELQYVDMDTVKNSGGSISEEAWKDVTADTNLFKASDDTLWEPGHTEVAFLRIKNVGDLTLKYNFNINAYGTVDGGEEKTYVNVLNNNFKLSSNLVLNQINGVSLKTRSEYWIQDATQEAAAIGQLSSSAEGIVLAPGETKDLTLVVYMPKSVGNDANQSSSDRETNGAPELYFGITLTASQAESETDSFGTDYDKVS